MTTNLAAGPVGLLERAVQEDLPCHKRWTKPRGPLTANDALLTAFLDKPEFRDALTRMIGNEFYKTIRGKASGE